MEFPNLKQEQAQEIKERIELNSFVENKIGELNIGEISSDDLLTTEEIELEKKKHKKRDSFYERFSINSILKFCLKEKSFNIENGIIEIDSDIDLKLPYGYGFKGGAARTILRQSLGLKNQEPRDYDLIRVVDSEPYDGADEELAAKYMEKDFELGDGVEFLSDIENYFETRDFTINEVCVVNNKIYATEDCIRDTLRGIVRVTDFELGNYQDEYFGLGPKMKAKALRFHVEQLYTTGVSEIYHEDINEIENSFINPFWIAVQLDRAFERSAEIAKKFTYLLIELNIIPNNISSPQELVKYLEGEIEGDFYFRSVPSDTYKVENNYSGLDEVNEELFWEEYFDGLR